MLDGVIYLSWNMLLVYYKKHLFAGLFYGEGALLPYPRVGYPCYWSDHTTQPVLS